MSVSLTKEAVGLVGAYGSRLAELPAPEDTWLVRNLPAAMQYEGLLTKCRQAGLVERAGYDDDANAWRWRTVPHAYEHIQAHTNDTGSDGTLPCGHTGFRNPRDTEGIECRACGTVHDPEVLR